MRGRLVNTKIRDPLSRIPHVTPTFNHTLNHWYIFALAKVHTPQICNDTVNADSMVRRESMDAFICIHLHATIMSAE
jgi:hypothetical protein